MADLLLIIVTVVIVGLGAFHLGRQTQKDRIEYLRDQLEESTSIVNDLMNLRQANTARRLRAVKDEA